MVEGFVLTLFLFLLGAPDQHFDQGHETYRRLLKDHVRAGLVDYRGLAEDEESLKDYLRETSQVAKEEFEQWGKKERLAFLINSYNAHTLALILEHYPITSIKSIQKPWKTPFVNLFGREMTLDTIEHELIRKQFEDPRVHFALVCAARGCPPLRSDPYTAQQLDSQLSEQVSAFLADTQKNFIDDKSKTIHLSLIFKWYKKDFGGTSEALLGFCAAYWPGSLESSAARSQFKIRFTHYDWALNDIRRDP